MANFFGWVCFGILSLEHIEVNATLSYCGQFQLPIPLSFVNLDWELPHQLWITRTVYLSFNIEVEMQKWWKIKMKIVVLFKASHTPSTQLYWVLNLEGC